MKEREDEKGDVVAKTPTVYVFIFCYKGAYYAFKCEEVNSKRKERLCAGENDLTLAQIHSVSVEMRYLR